MYKTEAITTPGLPAVICAIVTPCVDYYYYTQILGLISFSNYNTIKAHWAVIESHFAI